MSPSATARRDAKRSESSDWVAPPVLRRRRRHACAIVAAGLLACVATGLSPVALDGQASHRDEPFASAEPSASGIALLLLLDSMEAGGSAWLPLDAAAREPMDESATEAGLGSLPQELLSEMPLPEDAFEAAFDQRSGVVGYSVNGDADLAAQSCKEALEGKGWTCLPLEGDRGFSCMKDGGEYRWAVITFTQMGEATSVVVRLSES